MPRLPKIDPSTLADGQYATADEKARLVTAFVRWVDSDFKASLLTNALYSKFLTGMLSMSAEYNKEGFRQYWTTHEDGKAGLLDEVGYVLRRLANFEPDRWSDVAALFESDQPYGQWLAAARNRYPALA